LSTARGPLAGGELSRRLAEQLAFCIEVDKVKQVFRQNPLSDGTRKENDAEHMWHLALMAMVLAEYAVEPVDVGRVMGMVLVHDLVEIDAGDTFVYDKEARSAAVQQELVAADRIFNLLPVDQAVWMRGLWDEFEAKETVEARFAGALDRLQPMLMNAISGGGGWAEHGITADRVWATNSVIDHGSPQLWDAARAVLAQAVADGVLEPVVLRSQLP
jgi:putative hydrolase of HD superfamily